MNKVSGLVVSLWPGGTEVRKRIINWKGQRIRWDYLVRFECPYFLQSVDNGLLNWS